MRIEQVLTRNRVVTMITIIVVAACLLFSYLTLGGTEDDGGPRTVEELGDYVECGFWYTDDRYYDYRITLISVDEGNGTYMIERNDAYMGTFTEELGLIAEIAVMDTSGREPVGEEYVTTIDGDILCDVYETDMGRFLVSDGLILKGISEQGSFILYSTSMDERNAPGIVSARSDLMENDYIAMEYRTGNTSTVQIDIIDSVDGDDMEITSIQYIRNEDGTHREESKEEYGVEEYIGYHFMSEENQGGWTTDGSIVLLPTNMGNVLCNLYTLDEYRLWLGVSDRLAYRIDYADGFTTTVIGTSLVYDEPPAFDRSPANDITEGFSDTQSRIVIEADGDGIHLFTSDTVIRHVDDIENGIADISVTSLPWMDETTERMDVKGLSGRVDIRGLDGISGVAVLNTAFGLKLCLITYDSTGDIWSESEVDVFSDVMYMSVTVSDGNMDYWYLTDSDEVNDTRQHDRPMPGDAFMYVCEDPEGSFEELYCVYYRNGLHYVASDSDGFSLLGSLHKDGRYVGTKTVSTAFGELECRIYEVSNDYDIVRKVYMADGFAYPVYFEYTYDDYSQKGELVYISTM